MTNGHDLHLTVRGDQAARDRKPAEFSPKVSKKALARDETQLKTDGDDCRIRQPPEATG
jgi:hypothetical protein